MKSRRPVKPAQPPPSLKLTESMTKVRKRGLELLVGQVARDVKKGLTREEQEPVMSGCDAP
jgi:hypothetical protein